MSYSIWDVLNEAEDDEDNAPDPTESPETPDEGGAEDGDFSIDTSLDDEEDTPDSIGDDNGGDELSSPSEGSSGGDDSDSDEVNDVNTDIFASLTAEEQQIKIIELKRQFGDLYSACDELVERINNIDSDDDATFNTIQRVSGVMYDLRNNISDYISLVFGTKSYIENDIAYKEFLWILNSVASVLDKFITKKEKTEEKDNK